MGKKVFSMYHQPAPSPAASATNVAMRIDKLRFIGASLRRDAVAAQADLCYGVGINATAPRTAVPGLMGAKTIAD